MSVDNYGQCSRHSLGVVKPRLTRPPVIWAWWCHQIETFSALLAICAGNSPVSCEFPAQRPVTRSFDVFFDLRLTRRLSKQCWGWWFETPLCPLWRHRNGTWFFKTYTMLNRRQLSVKRITLGKNRTGIDIKTYAVWQPSLWLSWLECWFATLSMLSNQVRNSVGLFAPERCSSKYHWGCNSTTWLGILNVWQ